MRLKLNKLFILFFLLAFAAPAWGIGEMTFEIGIAELSKQLIEGLGDRKVQLFIEPFTEELTEQIYPLSTLLQNAISERLKESKNILEKSDEVELEIFTLRGKFKIHKDKILINAEILDSLGAKVSKGRAIIEKAFVDKKYFVPKIEDYLMFLASKMNEEISGLGMGYMETTVMPMPFLFKEKTDIPISKYISNGISGYLDIEIVRKEPATGMLTGEIIEFGDFYQVATRISEKKSGKRIASARANIPKKLIPESLTLGKKPKQKKKVKIVHSYRADKDEIGLIETMKNNALRAARRKLLKKLIKKPYKFSKEKALDLLDDMDENWIKEEDSGVKVELSVELDE